MLSSRMNQIVLQRKLTIPSSGKLFNRPKLVEKLNLYSQFPLTLIIAPAGYGKTSLVCDWLQYASHPVHWLSLDEQNNLPSSFWLYLCACLRHIDRDLDDKAERMLESHFIEDYCLISDLVLASLEKLTRKWNRPSRAVIVLDDFQFIDHPQILQSFNRFLDYIPSWLQVIITARKPPALLLANRYSKSTAHIISAAELIFQPEQIKEFLTIKLGIELSEQQQQRLFEKTEGWAAAIQLTGLALKSGTQFEDCTNTNDSLLANFLFDEVFSQLAVNIQEVLKDICIAEYFDLELCQLFNPNRNNKEILETLIQQGLFISKIESRLKKTNSYRLHSLFRHWIIDNCSLSQETIERNKYITLTWLTNNQSHHEALELSIELEAWQNCAELMVKLYPSLIQVTHFDHVSNILARIPENIILSLPHLCLLSAIIKFSRYEYSEVEEYLKYIETFFQSVGSQEYCSEDEKTSLLMGSMVLRGQIARFTGQRDKANTITYQLESQYYGANNALNCWVIFGKGIDCFFNDDISQSIQHNKKALALAKEIDDGLCAIAALSWLLHALYHNGQIQQAITLAEEYLAWFDRKGYFNLPNISSVYAAIAILYTENNQLDLAWQSYHRLLNSLHEFTEPREIIYNKFHTHYHLLSSTNRLEEARVCLQQLEHHENQIEKNLGPNASILLDTKTFSALLESRMGNNFPLLQLANQDTDTDSIGKTNYRFRALFEQVVQASGQMIMTSDETDLYAEIANASASSGNTHRQIICYLIPAQILFALGEEKRALEYFKLTLELASQYQFINLIIADEGKILPLIQLALDHDIEADYCQRLLLAIEVRRNTPSLDITLDDSTQVLPSTQQTIAHQINQDLVESLSHRELEVLNLINQGDRNKQIAETLTISVSTVKRHLQNIYQKLQVNSRTEAMVILNNWSH